MFEDSRTLEVLRLSNCKLSAIDPGTFANLPVLRYLNLGNNAISRLNKDMWAGPFLYFLFLNDNCIQNIGGDEWENISRLKYLDLHSNLLKNVSSQTWHGLRNLEVLELSNTSIAHVPPNTFTNLLYLRRLNLRSNELESLNPNVFGSNHPHDIDVGIVKIHCSVTPDCVGCLKQKRRAGFMSPKIPSLTGQLSWHSLGLC